MIPKETDFEGFGWLGLLALLAVALLVIVFLLFPQEMFLASNFFPPSLPLTGNLR